MVNVVVVGSTETIMDRQRIGGSITRSFPARGYVWIAGADGTDYFGHASHIQHGVDIYTVWIGQRCTFVPHQNGPDNRGPYAEAIVLDA